MTKLPVDVGDTCWKCKANKLTEADVKAARGAEWPLCEKCRSEVHLEEIEEPGELIEDG